MTAQATGPIVANDLEGSAVLHADALAPGETTSGEVTIRNAGDAPGAFTLSPSAALDTGAPPAGPLSAVLDLTVTDVSGADPGDGVRRQARRAPEGRARHVPRRRRAPLPLRADLPAGHPRRDRQRLPGRVDVDPVRLGRRRDRRHRRNDADHARDRAPATGSGGATGAAGGPAGAGGTAPATSPAAAAAIPATTAASTFRVTLVVRRKRPVVKGRLVTTLASTGASRARVTGTVSWKGHRRMKLRPTTVKLAPKAKTGPAAAARRGRPRRQAPPHGAPHGDRHVGRAQGHAPPDAARLLALIRAAQRRSRRVRVRPVSASRRASGPGRAARYNSDRLHRILPSVAQALPPMADIIEICPLSELPPGARRIVEWEDARDRRLQLRRRAVRHRGPLLARRRSARRGRLRSRDNCTVECPRHGSLFDLRTGKPKTLPAYVPVDTFPVVVEDDIVKLEVD